MQITFEISGEKEKNTSLVLSNDDYDNFNFVSIIIEGKEYTVSVDDLFIICNSKKN